MERPLTTTALPPAYVAGVGMTIGTVFGRIAGEEAEARGGEPLAAGEVQRFRGDLGGGDLRGTANQHGTSESGGHGYDA